MFCKKYITFFLFCLLLMACTPSDAGLSGRILLWHSFDEADTVVLGQILAKFGEIYPEVRVVSAAVPADELLARYKNTAAQGLGPDLLIGRNDWIDELAEDTLIQDISREMPDTTVYLSSAVETLRLSDPSVPQEPVPLYGLPLSVRPVALYYNTQLVSTPATTLDELLAHAADGQQVALNTNFEEAFWGIKAFGGKLFDESGRVILDQGGFANWLNWLKNAQSAPGMILNKDDPTLRELFIEEKAAYYVAGPEILPLLQEQEEMEGTLGVVPLPAGPHGRSGPLLRVEAIMFNPASSDNQSKLALELAKFLTNAEQNTVLMRETGRVPANKRHVDARAFPLMAGFATQASSAVPMSNLPQMAVVRELGNNTYTEVLQGATDLTVATLNLTNQVNERSGFDLLKIPEEEEETCQVEGDLHVWHPFAGNTEAALKEMGRGFEPDCPSTQVKLTPFATADELYNRFINSSERPDLIIGPHDWVLQLAENEQIAPITAEIDPTVQQAYMPGALSALRVGEQLFGLPFSLDLVTLYVNAELEDSPPTTLEEVLTKAAAGQRVIIPTNFDEAFWGISTFEDQLFDEEYRLLWEAGFIDWLTWLKTAKESPNIELTDDQALFTTGVELTDVLSTTNQAYLYVAPASQLDELKATFGQEQVRVARLPAGVGGEAQPLLHVDGFIFPDPPTDLALAFALHATSTKSQEQLMQQAQRVPINVNVNKEEHPAIKALFEQAQNAIVLPNVPQTQRLREQPNWIYNDVLFDGLDASQAVCQFTQTINEKNGFDPSDTSPACTSEQ